MRRNWALRRAFWVERVVIRDSCSSSSRTEGESSGEVVSSVG